MSSENTSSPFIVTEHVVPCSYINEYTRATSTGKDEPLYMFVKKYIPRDNLSPRYGDITIIGAHGNGLPKELYEPLWESIYQKSKKLEFGIRAIWIADAAHQNVSGVFNEHRLGNDTSCFDHSRDLLTMINHFRGEMPQPIMGIGHSIGSIQLALLSIMHPRLFTSVALMEPVMGKCVDDCEGPAFTKLSAFQKDVWGSHGEAVAVAKKMYKRWDPRIFDLYVKHGLRKLPTAIYPLDLIPRNSSNDIPVTLTTPKHKVAMSYLRPNLDGFIGGVTAKGEVQHLAGLKNVDVKAPSKSIPAFYHIEPIMAFKLLKYLRPHILFIFGSRSPVSTPRLREEKMERTGTGMTGNGGRATGNVKEVTLEGAGHLIVMEAVEGCADALAPWLNDEAHIWLQEQKEVAEVWGKKDPRERLALSDEALSFIKSKL